MDIGAAVQELGQRIRLRGHFSEQNGVEGLRLEGRRFRCSAVHRVHEDVRGSQRLAELGGTAGALTEQQQISLGLVMVLKATAAHPSKGNRH